MKRFIAAAMAIFIILTFCSCGKNRTPAGNTTKNDVTLAYANTISDPAMYFSFDIEKNYSYIYLSVNSGSLISETDYMNSSERPSDNGVIELYIKDGDGFYYLPAKAAEDDEAGGNRAVVISVQICGIDTTLNCGTLSLIKKSSILDQNNDYTKFTVIIDSDDGLSMRQNTERDGVIIYLDKE